MDDKQLEYFLETQSKLHSIRIRVYGDNRFISLISSFGCENPKIDNLSYIPQIADRKICESNNVGLLDEDHFLMGYVKIEQSERVVMIGPVRFGELTEADISDVISNFGFPLMLKDMIAKTLYEAPVMQTENLITLLSMFNLVINGSIITIQQILQDNFDIKPHDEEEFIETVDVNAPHSNGDYENALWYCIKNGLVEEIDKLSYTSFKGAVGKLGPTYLRSMKNALIALNTICLRAAISGGLDTETAYTLGNKYAQLIEAATSISDLGKISPALRKDYCQRVKNLSTPKIENMYIFKVTKYIQNNLYQKLSVANIAKEINISPVYLSALAKENLKCTLPQYINRQKISEAKKLLRFTDKPLADIATLLSYSSQSHFQNQFKKIRGITPMEYREKYRHKNVELVTTD